MSGPLQFTLVACTRLALSAETPVVTSFGTMRDRPMVLVRAEDASGITGWGEIWCNFPAVGAEHRARLVHGVLAPLATSRPFADAPEPSNFSPRRLPCSPCSRASRGRSRRRSPASTSRCGICRRARAAAAVAPARRHDAARARLCQRPQSRPAGGPRRGAAQRGLSRIQAEGRLRQGARHRQRRRAAQAHSATTWI